MEASFGRAAFLDCQYLSLEDLKLSGLPLLPAAVEVVLPLLDR